MKKASVAACTLAFSLLAASSALSQEQCEAFAKYGMYNISSTASYEEKVRTFRHWFCKQEFSTLKDARSRSASFGMKDISSALNIGASDSEEKFREASTEFCQDAQSAERFEKSTKTFIAQIDSENSKNMLACLNRDGLQVRILPSSDPLHFQFEARYISNTNPPNSATNSKLTATNATCDPLPATISASTVTVSCKRSNVAETSALIVNSDANPIWNSPRSIGPVPGVVLNSKSFKLDNATLVCADPKATNSVYCNLGHARLNAVPNPNTRVIFTYQIETLAQHVPKAPGNCAGGDPHRSGNIYATCGGIQNSKHFYQNNVGWGEYKHKFSGNGSCGSSAEIEFSLNPRGCTLLRDIQLSGEMLEVTK